jgi:hypothetical protein
MGARRRQSLPSLRAEQLRRTRRQRKQLRRLERRRAHRQANEPIASQGRV